MKNFKKTIAAVSIVVTISLVLLYLQTKIDFDSFGANAPAHSSILRSSLLKRMQHHNVQGVSIAVVKNGQLAWAKGYGVANTSNGHKVTAQTLFQAASVSKPLSALAALKLYEAGEVKLDIDANRYLKAWTIPHKESFDEQKMTIRRLLNHTAGISVHGFPGYKQGDYFPSDIEVLNGRGNSGAILVDVQPGSQWRYSGGGYTIIEKIVEDVSGLSFERYMWQHIFQPMGMDSSTYEQPLPTRFHSMASAGYDGSGQMVDGQWHNYPEQAAAGLWTTPSDLAKYCIEMFATLAGESSTVIGQKTIAMMLTADKNDWGLGPVVTRQGDELVFWHRGRNKGFTSSLVAFAHSGDAVIIMTNGDWGGDLIGEISESILGRYQWSAK
jgi:CubicO group peptidase (beta-lactamase class C family)